MAYVDGILIAVPTANREEFIKHAVVIAEIFKNHGANRVVDCWADDVPDGKVTSFPMAVKCKTDEAVCFSWVEWNDKATRDNAMPKVMDDMNNTGLGAMPFDGKRLVFGGFDVVSDV